MHRGGGTSLAVGKAVVTPKLLGIGVLSIGCLATAAVGGYLVLSDEAVPTLAQTQATTDTVSAVVVPEALPPPTPAPAPVVEETRVSRPAATPPALPKQQEIPEPPAAAPPAIAPPPPVKSLPRVPVATPVAAEPPRYLPDLAPPAIDRQTTTPRYEELTIEKHSVIGIRLDHAVSSQTAQVEDRVSAKVSRDVTVLDRIAIPAGVRLEGTIVVVDRGGRFRERPRLGLRFDTMILNDGTRVSIRTDTIYREGDSPSADATAKVGAGAVAGAILGGVLGGKKGAAIGGAAGAAGGAATVMRGQGNEIALAAGAPLTVRLIDDVTVVIQRLSG